MYLSPGRSSPMAKLKGFSTPNMFRSSAKKKSTYTMLTKPTLTKKDEGGIIMEEAFVR